MSRRRAWAWALGGALLGGPLLYGISVLGMGPAVAWAQAGPDVSLRADADDVEVGEPVTVTLTAMSDASTPQPADPQIKVPAGWTATGPLISTQTQTSIINGRVTRQSGFRAMWHLVPSAAGRSELGPASFSLSGKRVGAGSVRVNVRPVSAGGPRRDRQKKRRDPFGGIFGPLFDLDDEPPRAPEAPPPSQLSLDAPLEAQAFLRAIVDKPRAVVGEQVTLSVYLYTVPRSLQVVDPHEPSAPDFFQRVLSNGEGEAQAVNVGGSRWVAQMVRRVALFPLKAGDLTIGPMTLTLLGQGFRGTGMRGGLVRASPSLTVQVVEPPAGPRPAGYQLGDVGSFSLQAQVEPRTVEVGGSVAVTAFVRGTGNPPTSLRLPEQKGVSWLEPDTREVIDVGDSTISGTRAFTYIVKMNEVGKVDLGEVSVSFWNPKLSEYQVARSRLGTVEVTASTRPAAAAASASASPAVDPFVALAPARKTASPASPAQEALADRPWFWLLLIAPAGLVVLAQSSASTWTGLRRRRRERDESATMRARKALEEARGAADKGDARGAAAAAERAVVMAVEGATGVKVRALLASEVAPALTAAGLREEQAQAVVALLAACERERFQPGEEGSAGAHVAQATALVKELTR